MLFSLYVNDCSSHIDPDSHFIQYADDTSIFSINEDPKLALMMLEKNIEKTLLFFSQHKLKVNTKKTQFIVLCKKYFNKKVDELQLKVGPDLIPISDNVKFLGIWLDRNLTFVKQVNVTLQCMAQGITTLKEIASSLPPKSRINLMKSICLSHLQYPSLFFTGLLSHQLDSINRQINWAVKTANKISKYSHVSHIKRKQKILSAKNFISYRCLIYFEKLVSESLPIFQKLDFPRKFKPLERTKTFSTLGKVKMKILENSYLESTVKIFNALPLDIRSLLGSKKFKTLVFEHLLLQDTL